MKDSVAKHPVIYLFISLFISSNAFLIPRYYGFYDMPKPMKFDYNIDFWNLEELMKCPKYNISFLGMRDEVEVYEIYYLSEVYGGVNVTIHSLLAKPEGSGPFPALVLIHGTNGTCYSMFDYALRLAKEGFVVLAPTMPGRGKSSKFPPCTRDNIVNSTGGPKGAYYYHCVVATVRAISLLQSLDFVDPDRIGVSGASMGGIITFIASTIDPRVKAAVPIVACGEYDVLIKAGTLANLMIPERVSINSPEAVNTAKYFDVIAYATKLSKPTLMLVSTNDEFFTLNAINDTFSVLRCEKALNLAPNHGHFKEFLGWSDSALLWLKSKLLKEVEFPKIKLSVEVRGPYPKEIYVKVVVRDVESLKGEVRVSVFYHTNLHLSQWRKVDSGLNKSAKISVVEPTSKVLVFAALYADGKQIVSTPVHEVQVSFSLPLSAIAFIIVLFILMKLKGRISTKVLLNLSLWTLLHCFFLSPSIELIGRSRLTLFNFIDRYITIPQASLLGIMSIILLVTSFIFALSKFTKTFLIALILLSAPNLLVISLLNSARFPTTLTIESFTMLMLPVVSLILVLSRRVRFSPSVKRR